MRQALTGTVGQMTLDALMHDTSMMSSTRTLETMPLVMLSESPPSGYPATKIES